MYHTECRGGPMDGRPHDGKGGKGVVFVDKPQGEVHIYDWNGHELVHVRSDRLREGRLSDAVEDPDRDVRSLPEVSDG